MEHKDERREYGHVCPYHDEVKKIQQKRDDELVRVWGAVGQRLSTSMFLWIFGIAFGILISLQGVNYQKLNGIEISLACMATRLEQHEANILKNEIRYENLLRELSEHKQQQKEKDKDSTRDR